MTAILAAAARAVLGAVLVLAAAGSLLWVAYGPQGLLWTPAWLAAVFAVVTGAGLGIAALQPKDGGRLCGCPCNCPASGQRDDGGTPGWCDPCRMSIHQEA